MSAGVDLKTYRQLAAKIEPRRSFGRVVRVVGLSIEARGLNPCLGEACRLWLPSGETVEAEVVGFSDKGFVLMPLGQVEGLAPGNLVELLGASQVVEVGDHLLGQVLDGLGHCYNQGAVPNGGGIAYPVMVPAASPFERVPIERPLGTGIRVIDGLLTCAEGQRVGLFAGSGVGKSTLLGMIARYSSADVNVLALVGERGREVGDFLEQDLGPEGLTRSVVVAATSDQPAMVRVRAAFVATAIAEYFRDQGRRVLLLMDSLTRVAMAQREVGLAAGEPPATRGYPPSLYSLLPRLLERAGNWRNGSITAFYTVLVEGDDLNEPVADTARGLLDGHMVLSRSLANRNHYPAIDVLTSISRLMPRVTTPEHRALAGRLRELLALYQGAEDMITIGAYRRGTNPRLDEAVVKREAILTYLRQDPHEMVPLAEAVRGLERCLAS